MLIKCPECKLQVSDKAIICPHCGYPIQPVKVKEISSKRRRRLPNGFGQITKIKGQHLRKPYRAMVTVGTSEYGKPIVKLLKPEAYFETYNDAYNALVEYNKTPYDVFKSMNMNELFNKWFAEYSKTLKPLSLKNIKGAWKYCRCLYNIQVVDLKPSDIKMCVMNGYRVQGNQKIYPSDNVKVRIKNVLNQILDYAISLDLIDKNYARMTKLYKPKNITKEEPSHTAFTDEEIQILWKHSNDRKVRLILIQCYTGFRPRELVSLETKNIDLFNQTITGGSKTEAGIDRTVPIYHKIYPFVKELYEKAQKEKSMFLMPSPNNSNKPVSYVSYYRAFNDTMAKYNLNTAHKPHDPRKYFITTAKKYNLDEYAIKRIVGHVITDVTEKIYTERNSDWLKSEIEKIDV